MPSKNRKNRKTLKRKMALPRLFSRSALLRSTTLLYIVFFLALFNMLCLWMNQDNESMFLFIIIAFIAYTQNKNMILVLGIPFVVVNIMILLRTMFRGSTEGFFDYEVYKAYDLQEWVKNYVQKDDNKYADFTENISDELGSLSEKVRKVLDNPMTSKEDEREQHVNELKDFMLMVDMMQKDDPLYENDQVIYVRKMNNRYKRRDGRRRRRRRRRQNILSRRNAKREEEDMEEVEDMEEPAESEGFDQTMEGLSKIMNHFEKSRK